MPTIVALPDLGEGLVEGEIVRWLVREGDFVERDQPLVEVMTDKVTTELPSPTAGQILRLHGREGQVVPVSATLVEIDTETIGVSGETEPLGNASPYEPPPAAIRSGSSAGSADPSLPRAVPAVRRLARELGVDLGSVAGTGPGGRILDVDVRAAAAGGAATSASPSPDRTGTSRAEEESVERIPLRGIRRVIAEHLLHSHLTTAPYTLVEEVDFTELVGLRERVQPLAQKAGTRMTYLPFVIAALGMTLREHPRFNARVDPSNGDLVVHTAQHVAIAIHTNEGLVVPVIRHIERSNLLDLAREVERLTQAARSGSLQRDDMAGGTISVTSLGSVGGVLGTPMLNTPQVAVVGIHRIAPRPVVREGAVVPRQTANLSLTLDHRYIDGYEGARFAQTLKSFLEDPAVMLFSLAELRTGH